jgi:adenosylhomocysteine nucleosidase
MVIIMATMLEAKPFVQGLSLKKIEQKPFELFRNDNTFLIVSGIGKANASMAVAYCCAQFQPTCVCNLGAAGATNISSSLGEIFHISQIIELDRPLSGSNGTRTHNSNILKGFQTAVLATSDKAIIEPDERKKVAMNADLLDMEGASVVQACGMFETKCFMFKFVSDTPDHTSNQDIFNNIRLFRNAFYEYFLRLIRPAISLELSGL